MITMTCNEGLYLEEGGVEFLCNSNGSWTPDPAGQYCYEEVQEPGKHTKHETNVHWAPVKGLSCFTSDSPAGVASGVVVAVVVAVTAVAVACMGIAVTLVLVWKRKLPSKAIVLFLKYTTCVVSYMCIRRNNNKGHNGRKQVGKAYNRLLQ